MIFIYFTYFYKNSWFNTKLVNYSSFCLFLYQISSSAVCVFLTEINFCSVFYLSWMACLSGHRIIIFPSFGKTGLTITRPTSDYRKGNWMHWWLSEIVAEIPGNFSTLFFSADLKTYNNYGFGLYVISSDEGGGFIKSNTAGLSYSWRGYINKEKNIYFQLGVKGSYNDERLNFDRNVYSGNLDPIYGNIFTIQHPLGDVVHEKQHYWDFSAGAMICCPGKDITENLCIITRFFR